MLKKDQQHAMLSSATSCLCSLKILSFLEKINNRHLKSSRWGKPPQALFNKTGLGGPKATEERKPTQTWIKHKYKLSSVRAVPSIQSEQPWGNQLSASPCWTVWELPLIREKLKSPPALPREAQLPTGDAPKGPGLQQHLLKSAFNK